MIELVSDSYYSGINCSNDNNVSNICSSTYFASTQDDNAEGSHIDIADRGNDDDVGDGGSYNVDSNICGGGVAGWWWI